MFFYDLTLNAWVRKPGSKSPPEMTPVLTIGGVFDFTVDFCNGAIIANPNATGWIGGIKIDGDPAGEYVASDSAPTADRSGQMRFAFDLTEAPASAYFVANPAEDTVAAMIQIGYTDVDDVPRRTQPLRIILQNDYLQTP